MQRFRSSHGRHDRRPEGPHVTSADGFPREERSLFHLPLPQSWSRTRLRVSSEHGMASTDECAMERVTDMTHPVRPSQVPAVHGGFDIHDSRTGLAMARRAISQRSNPRDGGTGRPAAGDLLTGYSSLSGRAVTCSPSFGGCHARPATSRRGFARSTPTAPPPEAACNLSRHMRSTTIASPRWRASSRRRVPPAARPGIAAGCSRPRGRCGDADLRRLVGSARNVGSGACAVGIVIVAAVVVLSSHAAHELVHRNS